MLKVVWPQADSDAVNNQVSARPSERGRSFIIEVEMIITGKMLDALQNYSNAAGEGS
jgi:hypothetical protein